MYNNPYMNSYNPQYTKEKIDGEIAKLQQLKEQLGQQYQQPTSINQTFQLAPTHNGMRFVNSIDDVNKEIVYVDTPYFSNDLSVLWVKNAKGNVKVYELKEIVPKDEKDMIIDNLQNQLNELREEIRNAKPIITNVDEPIESEQPTNISSNKSSKTKSK